MCAFAEHAQVQVAARLFFELTQELFPRLANEAAAAPNALLRVIIQA